MMTLHTQTLSTTFTNNFCACQSSSFTDIRLICFSFCWVYYFILSRFDVFNGCVPAMDARLGFGTRLRWFCDRFVTVLWPFCDRFVTVLWPFCDRFVTVLWPFCDRFVTVLWPFCDRGVWWKRTFCGSFGLWQRCGLTWLGCPMSTVIRVTLTALLLRCPRRQRFFDIS